MPYRHYSVSPEEATGKERSLLAFRYVRRLTSESLITDANKIPILSSVVTIQRTESHSPCRPWNRVYEKKCRAPARRKKTQDASRGLLPDIRPALLDDWMGKRSKTAGLTSSHPFYFYFFYSSFQRREPMLFFLRALNSGWKNWVEYFFLFFCSLLLAFNTRHSRRSEDSFNIVQVNLLQWQLRDGVSPCKSYRNVSVHTYLRRAATLISVESDRWEK